MRKGLKYGFVLFGIIWLFRITTTDPDYFINDGSDNTDTTKIHLDNKLFVKPDTSQYKGNWVDVQ